MIADFSKQMSLGSDFREKGDGNDLGRVSELRTAESIRKGIVLWPEVLSFTNFMDLSEFYLLL